MIVIRKVEVLEVDEDIFEIDHRQFGNPVSILKNGEPDYMGVNELHREVVEGRKFYSSSIGTVVLGMPIEIHDLLKIPYGCFDNLTNQVEKLNEELSEIKFLRATKKGFRGGTCGRSTCNHIDANYKHKYKNIYYCGYCAKYVFGERLIEK